MPWTIASPPVESTPVEGLKLNFVDEVLIAETVPEVATLYVK
jgi:hypothetical protein